MAHIQINKDPLLARVRRIAGQMSAIERAIQDDAPCETVLHQVAGVRGAVAGLLEELIEAHLHGHVAQAGLSDAERASGANALITAIRRYMK